MNTPSIRQRGGYIDSRSPVNWQHPVNAGLVRCYLPFGSWQGGNSLRDLTRTGDGAITGSTFIPGVTAGFGALFFNGSSDFVQIPTTGLPDINGVKTVCGWAKWDGTNTERNLVSLIKDDSSSANNALGIVISSRAGFPGVFAVEWGDTQKCEGFFAAINLIADTWFHFAYTSGANWTSQKIYLNGVDYTLNTATSSQTGTTGACRIGSGNAAFPAPYINRPMTGVRIYNRALSVTEVNLLYQDELQGSPNVLNWVKPWVEASATSPPPPTGWGQLLSHTRNRLVQVG